jgi:hypothetical protein
MAPTLVRADFLADMRRQLVRQLKAAEYEIGRTAPVAQVVELYMNLQHRQIEARPREPRWSWELRRRVLTTEQLGGIARIMTMSSAGQSLLPFQTRNILRLDEGDLMLFDWGIHHLHLGRLGAGPRGLAGRTQHVLFVLPTEGQLLLIDVLPHGSGDAEPWTNTDLVEIVHSNWPGALARFREHHIEGDYLTEEQRTNLRANHMNVLTRMRDGTTYMMMGGGVMASGNSAKAAMRADQWMREADRLQKECETNREEIRKRVEARAGKQVSELRLELLLTPEGFKIQEKYSRSTWAP